MTLNLFKNSLLALALTNLVVLTPAVASPTLENSMRPLLVGKSLKTFGDFRKELSKDLSPEAQSQLAKEYSKFDTHPMPRMQITGNKMLVTDQGRTMTLELIGQESDFIRIDGKSFSAQEVGNLETFKNKLMAQKRSRHSYSFLIDLILPQAHALNPMLIGALMGVGGFWLFQKIFKKSDSKDGLPDQKAIDEARHEGYRAGYEAAARHISSGSGGSVN